MVETIQNLCIITVIRKICFWWYSSKTKYLINIKKNSGPATTENLRSKIWEMKNSKILSNINLKKQQCDETRHIAQCDIVKAIFLRVLLECYNSFYDTEVKFVLVFKTLNLLGVIDLKTPFLAFKLICHSHLFLAPILCK